MKKILIIDDNEKILQIFKQILVDEGFNVYTANNGNEGIAMFKEDIFHLVITDIKMPGMNGFDVLKNIKDTTPVIPIILISFDYLSFYAIKAKDLGASAMIPKTIDKNDFCHVVRSCLEYKNKTFF